MKTFSLVALFILALGLAVADAPDDLTLPGGFHATVVADSLGPIRHLAVRENGDIYVSTLDKGVFALHLDANHKADQIEHFGAVQGGTGIGFYQGDLYATNATAAYRFTFSNSKQLVPERIPDIMVEGMPLRDTGFNRENRPLAMDGKGNLFVGIGGSANLCVARNSPGAAPPGAAPNTPSAPAPVGAKPCPDLATRSGVWRFSADKLNQKFPADGEQLATGIRDMDALAWSPTDGHLYGIMHARDDSNKYWPNIISAEDDDNIADEMHRITKGTNFGWPYTYYDGVRKLRLIAPEYGGDGKTVTPAGIYDAPVLTFQSRRPAPMDLVFYLATNSPNNIEAVLSWSCTALAIRTAMTWSLCRSTATGVAGEPTIFADGFAGFDHSGTSKARAKYRPSGAAVGPDGALYIADSQVGRMWRIAYGAN